MIATTGTFDGVHAGHRFLLETLGREARESATLPLVCVLTPHPLMLVAPQRAPKLLTSPEERVALIREILPEAEVVTLRFDESLRRLTHREFMLALKERYGADTLLAGYDNRFGSDRDATPEDYVASGREIGMKVAICREMPHVSSSLVRKALLDGRVGEAADMLGRHYTLPGTVGHGNAVGRTIGFRTANLVPDMPERLVPSNGVYACRTNLHGKEWPAVVNIGCRPTVACGSDAAQHTIEAHVIGFDGDIYGSPLSLTFLRRLRDEKKFPSKEALAAQIKADVKETTGTA